MKRLSWSTAGPWVRIVLATLVVGLADLGGTVLGNEHVPSGRPMDWIGATLVLVTTLAILGVRAFPRVFYSICLLGVVAYYALGYHTDSPYFFPLLVAAYLQGAPEARVRTLAVVSITVALFGLATLLGHSRDTYGGLAVAAITVGALFTGQLVAELRAASDRRAREAIREETLRMVAEERLRIARELHDVVSHSISMINVQAGTAVHVMDERPELAREALLAIKAGSRDALRDLRGILGLLRGTEEEPRSPSGGVEQLPALVENVQRAGINVSLTTDGELGSLPSLVQLTVYRVVQEALTNVVRHAPGTAARVIIIRRPDQVHVTVEDDGGQISAAAENSHGVGHGIAGMRERVLAAGGSFEAGPRIGGGFSVKAGLPLA